MRQRQPGNSFGVERMLTEIILFRYFLNHELEHLQIRNPWKDPLKIIFTIEHLVQVLLKLFLEPVEFV